MWWLNIEIFVWNSLLRNSKKSKKRRKISAGRHRVRRRPALPTARRRRQQRRLAWQTRPLPAQMLLPLTAVRPWPPSALAVEPLQLPSPMTTKTLWPSNKNVSVNNSFVFAFLLSCNSRTINVEANVLLNCFSPCPIVRHWTLRSRHQKGQGAGVVFYFH